MLAFTGASVLVTVGTLLLVWSFDMAGRHFRFVWDLVGWVHAGRPRYDRLTPPASEDG